ncbi:MAG: hypothetical protein ACFUZC_19520 [Chthoniobacteraceae bacterium]
MIVLSMVALISIVLMAYMNRMSTDRSATFSYSQSLKAEQIARGSLRLIIADLQQEMGKDSAPDTTFPEKPLYTNVTGSNIAPQATGTCAGVPALIKCSGTSPSYTGTLASGTLLLSSTVNSLTPSRNGRFVDLTRWNLPKLGTLTTAPNWVILTRSGPTSGAGIPLGTGANTLNNPALSNTNYAVGRFAYTIYDEGGLLDITVAGYPKDLLSTPSAVSPLKGTLAGADLSVLGIDTTALVQWRNAASATSGTNYISYVTGSASAGGNKKVASGDRAFLSRQDLIKAAQSNIAGLTTAMLPNLTTFTREQNAPSWRPAYNASDLGGSNGTGNAYAYKDNALDATSVNPFISCVRRSGTTTIKSYGIDGVTRADYNVVPGDPVVYRRFPLDRMKWIGPGGLQNGATADAVQTCFGLHWDWTNGVWQYVGPTGTTVQPSIKTLAQVRDEGTAREPNFFELLQAGLLAGSLAKDGDSPATAPSNTRFSTLAQQKYAFHLFRIGANILSQYDSSSCPIVIEYNPAASPPYWQACGIESLPYLNFLKTMAGTTTDPNTLNNYFVLSLWNPHQGSVPSARPQVRLCLKGSFGAFNKFSTLTTKYLWASGGYTDSIASTSIELSQTASQGVNGFAEPAVPVQLDIKDPVSAGSSTGHSWALMSAVSTSDTKQYLGYRLPDFSVNPATTGTLGSGDYIWFETATGHDANDPFNAWMEFKTPGGSWIPYNYFVGMNDPASGSFNWINGWYVVGTGSGATPALPRLDLSGFNGPIWQVGTSTVTWATSDPRSIRFNPAMVRNVSRSYWQGSLWSSSSEPSLLTDGAVGNQAIPDGFYKTNYYLAQLSRNNKASGGSNTYSYPDPDGIMRIADSGMFTTSPSTANWEGDPYARSIDRPVVLNRPFYSVGELGYTSRDYPWRTLNFITTSSADSGLLDLFTVSQCSGTDRVIAGRLNLNTQNKTVLQSVLANTISDVVGAAALSKPEQIATDLAALNASGTNAMVGRDEIATKLVPSLGSSDFGTTDEQNIKTRREGVVRALADVGQTRTWNLMIDIVAQAGRYPLNASKLDQFVVEGERHYWLHVAIDRFTGDVIDQQLEVVTQ